MLLTNLTQKWRVDQQWIQTLLAVLLGQTVVPLASKFLAVFVGLLLSPPIWWFPMVYLLVLHLKTIVKLNTYFTVITNINFLTFSFSKIVDFMLVVSMVRVSGIEKVKLGISKFVLSDSSFKFGTISRYKTCSFVNNILACYQEKYIYRNVVYLTVKSH